MGPFEMIHKHGEHEEVVFCYDKNVGLKAIIAIHNTSLGPALGGTRMWNYKTEEEALTDVLRLSKGMTYKAAAAGLNLGGGKAVIIGDAKTRDLYRWLMFAALALSTLLSFFSPFYLLALLSLPLVARSVRQVASGAQGVELISLLGQTGRIQMVYAALLSLAAVLANR